MKLRARLARLEKQQPQANLEVPSTIMLCDPGGRAHSAWNLIGGKYQQTSRKTAESEVGFRARCASLIDEQPGESGES